MKCMVVDDSATMRRIVANALRSLGYDSLVEASDGNEALERWDESIDLIITDWNMPNMGGLDLVTELRKRPETASTAILMVTTRSVKADIIQAVQAGVNSYIVKPFTPQLLKEKIDEVMAQVQRA